MTQPPTTVLRVRTARQIYRDGHTAASP
jgi:hypothetical protein